MCIQHFWNVPSLLIFGRMRECGGFCQVKASAQFALGDVISQVQVNLYASLSQWHCKAGISSMLWTVCSKKHTHSLPSAEGYAQQPQALQVLHLLIALKAPVCLSTILVMCRSHWLVASQRCHSQKETTQPCLILQSSPSHLTHINTAINAPIEYHPVSAWLHTSSKLKLTQSSYWPEGPFRCRERVR